MAAVEAVTGLRRATLSALVASRRTSIHHNRPVETLLLVNISSMIPNPMAGAQVKTGNHPDMK